MHLDNSHEQTAEAIIMDLMESESKSKEEGEVCE